MNDAMLDHFIKQWCDALQSAYMLAKTQRINELKGNRTRTLDSRGIHPWTEMITVVSMIGNLFGWPAWMQFDPKELWRVARDDGTEEFCREWVAGASN